MRLFHRIAMNLAEIGLKEVQTLLECRRHALGSKPLGPAPSGSASGGGRSRTPAVRAGAVDRRVPRWALPANSGAVGSGRVRRNCPNASPFRVDVAEKPGSLSRSSAVLPVIAAHGAGRVQVHRVGSAAAATARSLTQHNRTVPNDRMCVRVVAHDRNPCMIGQQGRSNHRARNPRRMGCISACGAWSASRERVACRREYRRIRARLRQSARKRASGSVVRTILREPSQVRS
ncbi:hypothetical protein SAMN05216289_13711 [Dokdonella immobilis]|uniref:Uncharacterized protein n=1 Tax=Dokdonella immobilis TaxID=578942 RepID=A0A1I5AGA6_9GAMM|nr:hypothetical protein SAMN05216289_13711 [Dokdonella immobilis]